MTPKGASLPQIGAGVKAAALAHALAAASAAPAPGAAGIAASPFGPALDPAVMKREPLALNPVSNLTRMERKQLIAEGLRKRRNDALYALLTLAAPAMGQSR